MVWEIKDDEDTNVLVWFERRVFFAEADGKEKLWLPTHVARILLELAKQAPQPQGRPRISRRDRGLDSLWVSYARLRKRELLADAKAKGRHLTADDAAWQAAKEAAKKSR